MEREKEAESKETKGRKRNQAKTNKKKMQKKKKKKKKKMYIGCRKHYVHLYTSDEKLFILQTFYEITS